MPVTDHALIRWLDRVRGVPMEQLRAELAALVEPYRKLHVAHAEIGGFWFIFQDGKLVTISPDKPTVNSRHKNDRGGRNGTHVHGEKPHWKARQRRRDHR